MYIVVSAQHSSKPNHQPSYGFQGGSGPSQNFYQGNFGNFCIFTLKEWTHF